MRCIFGLLFLVSLAAQGMADTVTFQQGFNGYSGTVDTEIHSSFADESFSSAPEISVDLSTGGGQTQALIKFDGIIGNGAGQVAAGSTIQSASIRFWTTSRSGGIISFHRMLQSWGNDATWNTFGADGITADGVEALATASATLQPSEPSGTTFNTIDITADVQAWANGEANHGFGILTNSTDGWDFWSSEYNDRAEAPFSLEGRPLLSVTVSAVPEPSSMLIAGTALAGIAFRRVRRKAAKA